MGAGHCGAVRIETDSDVTELTTCDCSLCRGRNALMIRVHESAFRLIRGAEVPAKYRLHTHTTQHFFCRICCIYPCHRKRVTPEYYGINVFCPEDVDPEGIPVRATAGATMDGGGRRALSGVGAAIGLSLRDRSAVPVGPGRGLPGEVPGGGRTRKVALPEGFEPSYQP